MYTLFVLMKLFDVKSKVSFFIFYANRRRESLVGERPTLSGVSHPAIAPSIYRCAGNSKLAFCRKGSLSTEVSESSQDRWETMKLNSRVERSRPWDTTSK